MQTKIESIPGMFVASLPCARLPNSFPNVLLYVCASSGSLTIFLSFVIDSLVSGWMSGALKWSPVPGRIVWLGMVGF